MTASALPRTVGDAQALVQRLATAAAATAFRRRLWIVGGLVVVQWAIVAHEALRSIPHNGWLYYHGGDAPWYWTSAYTLVHGHVPQTLVGLGWPVVLMPFAAIAGPDMANGLPLVVLFNVVVLGAAAVIGMYLLAERVAGRLFGLWATAIWVIGPPVALALYTPHNRVTVLETFLPTGRGLNALSDYPAMVCAIFAAWLTLRAFDRNRLTDGVLCGVVVGFLIEVKPSNGPLAVCAAALLAAGVRWRALGAAAVAIVPALVALTLWKHTGLGTIPALSQGASREASDVAISLPNTSRYFDLDWHHLMQNIRDLQEVFWSPRLLEFILVGGGAGLWLRARVKGLFVLAWFLFFGILKGSFPYSNVEDASVYRFLEPAWPAWILLVAGVALLWPVGAARRRRWTREDAERTAALRPAPLAVTIAAAVLFALAPLAVAATTEPIHSGSVAFSTLHGAEVSVVDFGLRATVLRPGVVRLSWKPIRTSRASYSYTIFKGPTDGCTYPPEGAQQCNFDLETLHSTPLPGFVDPHARGTVVYRVGLAATWRVDPNAQDLLLLSTPVTVHVPSG